MAAIRGNFTLVEGGARNSLDSLPVPLSKFSRGKANIFPPFTHVLDIAAGEKCTSCAGREVQEDVLRSRSYQPAYGASSSSLTAPVIASLMALSMTHAA